MYPPNTVALGCIYTAALLSTMEPPSSSDIDDCRTANLLKEKGEWERVYMAEAEDLEGESDTHINCYPQFAILSPYSTHTAEIAHVLIDLLMQAAQNPSANTSPRTPSSPSPHPSPRNQHYPPSGPPHPPSVPYKSEQLLQLKITMRENEHPTRLPRPLASSDPSAMFGGNEVALLGKNEGTVRFLFGPPGVVGHGV